MTRNVFNRQYATLMNAFPSASEKLTGQTQDIYWMALKSIPDEILIKAVRKVIQSRQWPTMFPTIQYIGDACMGENYQYCNKKLTWRESLRVLSEGKGEIERLRIIGPIKKKWFQLKQ